MHDGRIDIISVATQESAGAQKYAADRSSLVDDVGVSPGRSVIQRDPRAKRKCGNRHNNRPRPLSWRLADPVAPVVVPPGARDPVVTGERRGCEVENWRRAAAFSHFQFSGNVSPCQFARLTHERDVHLQTSDCELSEI